jgi:hypothetical protein
LDAALGVLLLAVYIVGIISLAAGMTYGVIRIFPTERKPKGEESAPAPAKSETPANGGTQAGSLFRRSKRRTR